MVLILHDMIGQTHKKSDNVIHVKVAQVVEQVVYRSPPPPVRLLEHPWEGKLLEPVCVCVYVCVR